MDEPEAIMMNCSVRTEQVLQNLIGRNQLNGLF